MLAFLRRRVRGIFQPHRRHHTSLLARTLEASTSLTALNAPLANRDIGFEPAGAGNGMTRSRIVPNRLGKDAVDSSAGLKDRFDWLATMADFVQHGTSPTGDVHGELAWFEFTYWQYAARRRGVTVGDVLAEFRRDAGLPPRLSAAALG